MVRRQSSMVAVLVFGKALVFALIVATPLFAQPSPSIPNPPKKVLIFFSEPAYIPSTTMLDQSFRLTLNNGSSDRIQFYYDALDNFRIPNERYENELVGLLRRKYDGEHVNLVIPVGVPAIKFWLNHKDQLFPEIPVVFFSLDENSTPAFDPKLNVTGVSGKLEFGRTLGIALTLHPDTRRVGNSL